MSIRSMTGDVVVPMTGRPGAPGSAGDACPCRPDRRTRAHHDRLLRVEADPDELLELLELAVTWSELDWSCEGVVAPERWVDLAASHGWVRPDRIQRLFGLAADIALRGEGATTEPVGATGTPRSTPRPRLTTADLLAGEL